MSSIFNVNKDKQVIEAGGFFCQGCLVGKPSSEGSSDIRYCQSCHALLLKEVALQQSEDSWSADGQLYYHGSKGYGLNDNLQTIQVDDRDELVKKHPVEIKKRQMRRRRYKSIK